MGFPALQRDSSPAELLGSPNGSTYLLRKFKSYKDWSYPGSISLEIQLLDMTTMNTPAGAALYAHVHIYK